VFVLTVMRVLCQRIRSLNHTIYQGQATSLTFCRRTVLSRSLEKKSRSVLPAVSKEDSFATAFSDSGFRHKRHDFDRARRRMKAGRSRPYFFLVEETANSFADLKQRSPPAVLCENGACAVPFYPSIRPGCAPMLLKWSSLWPWEMAVGEGASDKEYRAVQSGA